MNHMQKFPLSKLLGLSLALPFALNAAAFAYSDQAFDQGRDRMVTGDYDGAVAAFGESIGMNASDPRAYVLRGECFFKMGNYALAIQDLTTALQYAPNNIRALLLRGTCHANLGKDDQAIIDFQNAIRMDATLADRYFSRTSGGGVQAYEKLKAMGVDLSPVEQDEETNGSGLNVQAVRDYQEAMSRLYPGRRNGQSQEQAVGAGAKITSGGNSGNRTVGTTGNTTGSASPRTDTHAARANKSASSSDLAAGGVADIDAVGNPNEGVGKKQLPYIFTDAQNNAGIEADDTLSRRKNQRFTPNLDQDPNRGEFGLIPGAGLPGGDPKKAIYDYSQGIKMDPTNAEYYYKRAKAFQKLFKVNDAMEDFNHAILQDPQQAKYYVGRASLYYQLDRQVLCDADIVAARNCNPDLPAVIHFNLPKLPKGIDWAGDGPRD